MLDETGVGLSAYGKRQRLAGREFRKDQRIRQLGDSWSAWVCRYYWIMYYIGWKLIAMTANNAKVISILADIYFEYKLMKRRMLSANITIHYKEVFK